MATASPTAPGGRSTAGNGGAQGWLWKQGQNVRNWKRRWFVLESQSMTYFAEPGPDGAGDGQPLGVVPLEGSTLCDANAESVPIKHAATAFVIRLRYNPNRLKEANAWHNRKHFLLAALDKDDLLRWKDVLGSSCANKSASLCKVVEDLASTGRALDSDDATWTLGVDEVRRDTITVPASGVVSWNWRITEQPWFGEVDLIFSVRFVSRAALSEHSRASGGCVYTMVVVGEAQSASTDGQSVSGVRLQSHSGSFQAPELHPGELTLCWDNSHSWFRSKNVTSRRNLVESARFQSFVGHERQDDMTPLDDVMRQSTAVAYESIVESLPPHLQPAIPTDKRQAIDSWITSMSPAPEPEPQTDASARPAAADPALP